MAANKAKKAYAGLLSRLGKRPRAVLEKILENGSVSTYELGLLGYDQPPRAAQDLKECGVSLKTTFSKHPKTGARMAVYSLAEGNDPSMTGFGGRRAFTSKFRADVAGTYGSRCNLCNAPYDTSALQLDHRVPYIVAGEVELPNVTDFQLLCGSHQRKKSWACEHCLNRVQRDVAVCESCFWAYPDAEYTHVATIATRRFEVNFAGPSDAAVHDAFLKICRRQKKRPEELLREMIARFVSTESE